MFFFFSEELRRINRAPTALTSNTYDPAWLTDPTNANYVPPALRDPNAVKLLTLLPTPNVTGRLQFLSTQPTIQNTRQEVVRVDYDLNANYRLTGRYTHDNSFTEEPGGLFLGLAVPNVATTDTNVPGQVARGDPALDHGASKLNELQFQFSSNQIADTNQAADRNLRSSLGLNIPEVFPGQRSRRDAAGRDHRHLARSAPTSCSTSSTRTTPCPTASPGSAARTASSSAG